MKYYIFVNNIVLMKTNQYKMLCIGNPFTYLSAKTSVTIKDTHTPNFKYVSLDSDSIILNLLHNRDCLLYEGFPHLFHHTLTQ